MRVAIFFRRALGGRSGERTVVAGDDGRATADTKRTNVRNTQVPKNSNYSRENAELSLASQTDQLQTEQSSHVAWRHCHVTKKIWQLLLQADSRSGSVSASVRSTVIRLTAPIGRGCGVVEHWPPARKHCRTGRRHPSDRA